MIATSVLAQDDAYIRCGNTLIPQAGFETQDDGTVICDVDIIM
jgi:hypothetical protein